MTPAGEPITITRDGYDGAFKTAIATLRSHRFMIDRQDYRFGHISTIPRPSTSAFEFWTGEHSTLNDAVSSTTNDQQRIVQVTFQPVTQDYQMTVEVTIERAQHPYRVLTGSTDGHAIAGELEAIPVEQQQAGVNGRYWQAVGRDQHMERAILEAIRLRLKGDVLIGDEQSSASSKS